MAAVDYFLKLDGIAGESRDDKHKGEIDVMSFSWGVSQTGTFAAGGGGGAGKAQFQDIHFTKGLDKASPSLFIKCATGAHIKEAILVARKAGGEGNGFEFLKITLTDVLVSGYQTGGSSGVVPTDQFSLNFAKIEYSYTPQTDKGTPGTEVTARWDLKQNKAV